jgi:Pyridine nucleotide-disulphide oxidoreductase
MTSTGYSDEKSAAIIQQVLRASTISSFKNVVALGTRARRVNFASQQTRALNLVWALRKSGKVGDGSSVAVVGAGLSGLTAAASLKQAGCQVTLFDKYPEVLFHQRHTHHRYVHPTINFWPEQEINPTTTFPFFDWFAGRCSTIVDEIATEWDKHFSSSVTQILDTEVISVIADGSKPRLRHKVRTGVNETQPFDLVVLALGFGDEITIEGCNLASYWRDDLLEQAHSRSDDINIVCGVGDGGLIDLFRLAFKSSFRNGRLLIEFANRIAASPIGDSVAAVERACEALSDEEASIHLARGYKEAVALLEPTQRQILSDGLLGKMKGRIILVGPQPSPFSKRSAPLHKLVLACLADDEFFRYETGKIETVSDGFAIFEDKGKRKIPHERLFCRVGSTDNITQVLKNVDLTGFYAAQDIISDVTRETLWEGAEICLQNGDKAKAVTDPEYIQDRILRSQRIKEMYPAIDHLSRRPTKEGRAVIVAELYPNERKEKLCNFPRELFGVPLEVEGPRFVDIDNA